MSVEFRSKSVGQHGANIFYTEFSVLWNSIYKTYRLGHFYFVQKDDNPVTIAECQVIWKNTYNNKRYASCKLYFNPEDADDEDWDENMEQFGKNEVIEANRQVVIECSDFPSWECESKLWDKMVGEMAFHGIPREIVKQITKRESTVSEFGVEEMAIKIISFPEYCRLQACYKMIKIGLPMTYKLFLARGGVQVKNLNTLILFSRWQFCQPGIDDFSTTRNVTVPVFKGRPRKKKRKEFLILKKRKEKKLREEMQKLFAQSGKRKYTKHQNVENPQQDIHASANAAASRILNKYKKKNEKATEEVGQIKYSVPHGRKATDGRLKINRVKKAIQENIATNNYNDTNEGIQVEKEDYNKEDMESESMDSGNVDIKSSSSIIIKTEVEEEVKNESNGHVIEMEVQKLSETRDLPRDEFIKDLYAFMEATKNPIVKVPIMGRAQVDLYDLFTLVKQYGGYTKVTHERKWRDIYNALGRHANTNTNPATMTRKIYENLLMMYSNSKKTNTEEKEEIYVKRSYDLNNTTPQKSKCIPIINIPHVNKPITLENITIPIESVHASPDKLLNINTPIVVPSTPPPHTIPKSKHMRARMKYTPPFTTPPNHSTSPQTGGTTSFTLQAGEAFKLMIQKRRGRPSKDFRRQIEELKTMNRKMEVEVFPPIGKRTRLPSWLNELNVDIVNPRRKRKLTADGKIAPRKYITSTEKSPQMSSPTFVNNPNEISQCTMSKLKNDTPYPTAANGYAKLVKSPNGYNSMVAINADDNRPIDSNNEMCEFSIKSVHSLANTPHTSKRKRHSYIHRPPRPPQTIIPYGGEPPPNVLPYGYIPSHHSNHSIHPHHTGVPIRHFMPPYQISQVRMKSPTLPSFESKIMGPHIRHIYLNNEKRVYASSNHRSPEENRMEDNVHLEKVYVSHSSHLESPNREPNHERIRSPNGNSNYEPIRSHNGISHYGPTNHSNGNLNHEPYPVTILPSQSDSKSSSLKFHHYKPPTPDEYTSPTKRFPLGTFGNHEEDGTIFNTSFDYPVLMEEQPKVYILPS